MVGSLDVSKGLQGERAQTAFIIIPPSKSDVTHISSTFKLPNPARKRSKTKKKEKKKKSGLPQTSCCKAELVELKWEPQVHRDLNEALTKLNFNKT